jgi:hypothetical protein
VCYFCLLTFVEKPSDKANNLRTTQTEGPFNRTLCFVNVDAHIKGVGLDHIFASHFSISAFGGQKIEISRAAALFNREDLDALAKAIDGFAGGVSIISLLNEFVMTSYKEARHGALFLMN